MKIFLAGIYSFVPYSRKGVAWRQLFRDNNYFGSYYYPQGSVTAALTIPGQMKICDSGAHTFFAAHGIAGQPNRLPLRTPKAYFEDYVKWIQQNYDLYDYFVELDIQELVGYKQIQQWRRIFQSEGIAPKMIWAHHSVNTFQEYQRMVDTVPSRYVGLQGIRAGVTMPYGPLLAYAYKQGCRVHGFALVRNHILEKFPFFSVDSTSWQSIYRYGGTWVFDKGQGRFKFLKADQHSFRRKITEYWARYKLPPKLLVPRDPSSSILLEKLQRVVQGYRQVEKYYSDLWLARGVDWASVIQSDISKEKESP